MPDTCIGGKLCWAVELRPGGQGDSYNVEFDTHVSPIEAAAIPADAARSAGGHVQQHIAPQTSSPQYPSGP